MTYTEPLAPKWFSLLTEHERAEFLQVHERHAPLGYLAARLGTIMRVFLKEPIPALPLSAHIEPEFADHVPENVTEPTVYRELLEGLLSEGRQAIAEFRVYRDRALARQDVRAGATASNKTMKTDGVCPAAYRRGVRWKRL